MTTNAVTDRRERFRALHAQGLVVMPNASGGGEGTTGTDSYLDFRRARH